MNPPVRLVCLVLVPVLLWTTGCASVLPAREAPAAATRSEAVSLTVDAEREAVIDAATSVLVANGFAITLANERIGLLQTDYLPLSELLAAQADSLGQDLDRMLLRLTLNAEPRDGRQVVQVRGTFQPVGEGRSSDGLVGLYWMEQVVQDIAEALGASYEPQVTRSQLLAATDRPAEGPSATRNVTRVLLGVAIVLFAVTLVSSTVGPGSTR